MIQLPENLKKVCRDNTIKALAMLDSTEESSTKSLDEYQNFYQAKVFLQKFKMDGWLMCRQIWESVWENLVNDIDIEDHNITYIKTPEDFFDLANDIDNHSIFTVSYEVNKKFDINLSIILYWQSKQLGIYSSIDKDRVDFPIIQTPTKLTVINRDIDNDIYNVSQHTVSLKNSDTISDNDIELFRKSAKEIIKYFNEHKDDIIDSLE